LRRPIRVLGIDTSLRSSGVGLVEAQGPSLKAGYHGLIKNAAKLKHTDCLANIFRTVSEIIEKYQPDAVAVEGIFFSKNPQTAMILGQARGTVLAASAMAGLPVYEYPPRTVKQAVVGTGTAHKEQVAKMVVAILGLSEEPPEDAADALAIAIAHIHTVTGNRLTEPKEI